MKKFLKVLAILALLIIALAILLIERIDRTPFQETAHFQSWKEEVSNHDWTLDSLNDTLLAGWAKVNITPSESVPMAGYGARWGKHYKMVHDSVFVRAIAIQPDQDRTLYFLSADLLIIPPNVKQRLIPLLAQNQIDIDDIHFGATHTHTSIGGWGQKLIGSLFAGKYDENVEIHLAEKMYEAILEASKNKKTAEVSYWESQFKDGVNNRLKVEGGVHDDMLRGLYIQRSDSTEALLVTFTAHTTLLRHSDLELSRDFPGFLVDSLETLPRVDFAMYMAGAVGSMSSNVKGEGPYVASKNLADSMFRYTDLAYKGLQDSVHILSDVYYSSSRVVPFPPSNARISINYALRPWVFASLFGASPAYIKITRLGDVLILGMPADFSGEIMLELEEYAKTKGLQLIITSFNGEYIGYVTSDKWYEYNLYETTTMSWYGYQAASYLTQASKDIIDQVANP